MAALSLSACGGGRTGTEEESTGGAESGGDAAAAGGFAADAAIGVSLPWLGTQNWKEADTMFQEELAAAGFTPIVQAADNKVAQQQQQIEGPAT